MATLLINGRFIDPNAQPEQAVVSAFDAGLQHGVGLFETFSASCSGGEAIVPWLDEHLARLARSAQELALVRELNIEALAEAVRRTVEHAGLDRARVRLTITGGDLNLLARAQASEGEAPSDHQPTLLIACQPATEYPPAMYERGVHVGIADSRLNPLNTFEGHKTLDYWWRLRELQRAGGRSLAEAVVLQVSNHVAGGCVSSVIVRAGERVLAPIARGEEELAAIGRGGAIMPSPVLPGTTRQWALGLLPTKGYAVERRMLTITDLLDADEVVLTNASWGVLAVVRVESKQIGAGIPGPMALLLIEEHRRARGW